MAFDFSTLVTDRTQQDVAHVKQLIDKLVTGTATDAEKAEWNSFTLKGAYKHTDLNRVTAAMEYLKSQLESYGYAVPGYQRIEVPHPDGVILPKGYTKLEWIESTGTQYVDTLFKSNYNSRIVAEVQFKEEPQIVAIFGTRNATTDDYFCFYAPEQQGYCLRIDGAYNYVTASAVERNVVDANKNVLTIGNNSVTGAVTDFSANYPLYLFAANNAGTAQYVASAKLFSCRIYDDDTLVRNYIPCINSVGDVGLYDLVTEAFFGNSGTGVFIAGTHIVELPSGYTRVEYIESSGTQFVDTVFTPTDISKFKFAMDVAFLSYTNALYGDGNTFAGYFTGEVASFALFGGTLGQNTNATFNTNRHAFELDGASETGSIDGVVTSVSAGSTALRHPFYLFGWNADKYSSSRLYSAQLYYDGAIVRDYVPCINPSGEVGLYDLVMATFCGNNGTGVFTNGTPMVELPYGYKRVDYIASTGTQYIDTGVKSTSNTRIKLTLKLQAISGDQKVFGGYEPNGGINLGVYDNKWRLGAGSWDNNTLSATTEKTVIEAETNTWIINGSTITTSSAIATAYNSNMFVFGICYNGSLLQTDAISVYELRIYDSNVPIRYFIPCINPSGEVGLYDIVTKKFYRNQGTGEFVSGDLVEVTQELKSKYDPYLWYEVDYPTESTMIMYLGNVTAIRSVLAVMETTPDTPSDMVDLMVQEANDIEVILLDVYRQLAIMATTFIPCGEALSGGENL